MTANQSVLATKHRTHTCGELNSSCIGEQVTLMGHIHVLRDLGGLIFIDLRDHYGLTQILITPDSPLYTMASTLKTESVIKVEGTVQKRGGPFNKKLSTGEIEVVAEKIEIESVCELLPFPIAHNPKEESDDTRLRYRYLDLRTEKMHKNILFYNEVIRQLRLEMSSMNFVEFQTPILTSSSPEGARDFLVPSRLHPGQFYALPQAPQQFKQILMCSGFDRYFQIAPCFRDEDPRADRAPGEFYQLDIEMSYVGMDDVFAMAEKMVMNLWNKMGEKKSFPKEGVAPFKRLPWKEAMETYGTDKPDLRFDLPMIDLTDSFKKTEFKLFKGIVESAGQIRAMKVEGSADLTSLMTRKFFDKSTLAAKDAGLAGLPYLVMNEDGSWKGSIAKALSEEELEQIKKTMQVNKGDALFFVIGEKSHKIDTAGGKLRTYLAQELKLIRENEWSFLWVVDFPMFEESDDEERKIDFAHNPFSMPQGGMDDLVNKNPLDIYAYQYDLVCNGYELASGAIRNHRQEVMKKAFEIAGYGKEEVESRFGALWNAFSYGPPPHGGMAFGIARMVMLLLGEQNIREVIAFPMNGRAMDVMMQAPNFVSDRQMQDVHVKMDVKEKDKKV